MQSPECNLMERFRMGNSNAFREIYDLYAKPVFYYAVKLLRNENDAQDVVGDSFRKLWEARASFAGLNNVRAFLFVVARNGCIDYVRLGQKEKTSHEEYRIVAEESEDYIINMLVKTNLLELVRREVEKLPAQRRIVLQYYLKGMETDEIAKALDMNPVTVRTNKKKAITQLRDILLQKRIISLIFSLLCVRADM